MGVLVHVSIVSLNTDDFEKSSAFLPSCIHTHSSYYFFLPAVTYWASTVCQALSQVAVDTVMNRQTSFLEGEYRAGKGEYMCVCID